MCSDDVPAEQYKNSTSIALCREYISEEQAVRCEDMMLRCKDLGILIGKKEKMLAFHESATSFQKAFHKYFTFNI